MNKAKQKRLEANGRKFSGTDAYLYGAVRTKPKNNMATRLENLPSRGVSNSARGLLIVSALALAVYVGSCAVLLLATDADACIPEPPTCTSDADCAERYPDLDYGTDLEGYQDA